MPTFSITQGDIQYATAFSQPLFSLFSGPGLIDPLFQHLFRHGWRLNDFKFERGTGNLGENSLTCYNLQLNSGVKVWLDRLEINFWDVSKVTQGGMQDIVAGTVESIIKAAPGAKLTAHTISLGFHGHLGGETFMTYIQRYASNQLQSFGSLIGQGVVFYFGVEGPRKFLSVVLDASGAVQGGLFCRFVIAYDAERVAIRELKDTVARDVEQIYKGLGLEISSPGER